MVFITNTPEYLNRWQILIPLIKLWMFWYQTERKSTFSTALWFENLLAITNFYLVHWIDESWKYHQDTWWVLVSRGDNVFGRRLIRNRHTLPVCHQRHQRLDANKCALVDPSLTGGQSSLTKYLHSLKIKLEAKFNSAIASLSCWLCPLYCTVLLGLKQMSNMWIFWVIKPLVEKLGEMVNIWPRWRLHLQDIKFAVIDD